MSVVGGVGRLLQAHLGTASLLARSAAPSVDAEPPRPSPLPPPNRAAAQIVVYVPARASCQPRRLFFEVIFESPFNIDSKSW